MALSRFRNIRLVSSASLETRQTLTQNFLKEIHQVYRADYLLNCDAYSNAAGNGFTLHYSLAHTLTDEIIWTDQISLPHQPGQHDLEAMYRWLVANAVSLHSGALLRHWVEYMLASGSPLPAAQQTLIHYIAFLRDISPETFAQALKSCRARLKEFPDDSKALVIFARLCGYDHTLQYNQIANLETEWTSTARMSMKLDPGNAEAHSVFAHNSYYRGDYALSRAELETARQANPYDTACEYLYGLGYCLMGEWDKGMAAIQDIMGIHFNQPAWYHVLPFLNAFNQQDYATALVYAERIQDFAYWGDMARTVTLFRLGKHERAFAEAHKLLTINPGLLQGKDQPDQRKLSSHPSIASVWKTVEEMQALLVARTAKPD